ncbi:MAG TPA: hypothetical protein PLU82_01865, partial [Oscillospiraceae bacterium]|nr:hypothetical protein [Oscillospiraceae bacterium]
MLFFACEAARPGLFCRRKSGRISAREKAETAKAAALGRIPPDFTSHRDFRAPKSGGEFFIWQEDSSCGETTVGIVRPRTPQEARNAFPANRDFLDLSGR